MSSPFSTTTTDIVLYTFRLLFAITLFFASTSQADPLPVKQPAFAHVGRYLYVQGGIVRLENKFTPTNQFFALDLEASWSVNTPRWKALSSSNSYTPSIGLHTRIKHSDMFTTLFPTTSGSCFISSYNTTSGGWLPDMTLSIHEVMDPAFLPVVVPYSDSIYIASSNKMNILKLDDGSIRFLNIPANIFSKNNSHGGAVHSGDQIFYIGGSNTPEKPQISVNAFNLTSERWDTLKTTGDIPPLLVDPCIAADVDSNTIVLFGGTLLNNNVSTQTSEQTSTQISTQTSADTPMTTSTNTSTNTSNAIYILSLDSLTWRKGPPASSPRTQMACTLAHTRFLAWGGSDGQNIISGPPVVFDLSKSQWVSNYVAIDDQFLDEEALRRKIIAVGVAAGCVLVIVVILIEYIYIRKKRKEDYFLSLLEQQAQNRMIIEGDRVNREKSTTTRRMDDSPGRGAEDHCHLKTIPPCYHRDDNKDPIQRNPQTPTDFSFIASRNSIHPSNSVRNPQRVNTPSNDSLPSSAEQVLPLQPVNLAQGMANHPRCVM